MQSITERTNRVFVDILEIDPKHLIDGAELSADLGIDSLHQVELIMAIEEEFGIIIENRVADRIVSLGDVVKLVGKLSR